MPDEKRLVRICEACLQVDDHPRHRLATAPGEGRTPADVINKAISEASAAGHDLTFLLEQAQDDAVLDKHFDCCAADGCNLCAETLAAFPEKDRHGLALAKANAPKDVN